MRYLILLFIFIILIISGCENEISDEKLEYSCPHGLENDPYPGRCGQYTDGNNNEICDYSE